MKKILNNDKLELSYDSYERLYTLSLYDTYGHYIDDIKLSREEINDLYKALEGERVNFQ